MTPPGPDPSLRDRLENGPPLVFDGATGTELERRGQRTGLPLWSTHALLEAPEVVEAVHADYVRAGAEVLIANTFRTQRRTLARASAERAGLAEHDAELTALAVDLARQGARRTGRRAWVAGSAPPLEDCYHPERVPGAAALAREHGRHAEGLAHAGVDLVVVETMNTVREAEAAVAAAHGAGLDCVVSFVCWEGPRLLSGEALGTACERVARHAPLAVGVNCLPPSNVDACLAVLAGSDCPFGVYPNLGEPEDERGFRRSEATSPDRLAERAVGWVASGARYVGGCCGTTPDHIAAIARALARA
jgi:S-methylmethionine-dependent homocysteine/selenocysteine methylase